MIKQHFIDKCVTLAQKSTVKHQHGSIIVKAGKIIGSGYNKNNPYNDFMNTCHAEIDAILSLNKQVFNKPTILYVLRLSGKKTSIFGNSKPCNNCMNKIKKHNISRVYYSTPDGFDSVFI